jgi:DNA-binding CsgD family transcriptional regulator
MLPVQSMEMLEREQCLAHLAEWLSAADQEGGRIALVAGEAGIGKTTLINEFCRRQRGTRVLSGACDALFTPRPLAPLHDIARQSKGALWTALHSGASREEIFTSALDELERDKALVIFEDMHWADEATLDLLKYLGRRIHRTHSMLVLTYRYDEVGSRHPLRHVIGDLPRASVRRVSLLPLSEAAVERLATQANREFKRLHGLTGGNPLFVTEVLAAPVGSVPATVRDAVLARVGRLPPAAYEVAELVCVVPGRTECWLLEAAGVDEEGIEDCLGIGMIRHEDGSLAYRHELARRAVEDSLSPARLRSLHQRVLDVLAPRPDVPAARLAHHADGAGNAAQVLRFAPMAAEQAKLLGAHRAAASHYQITLRYADRLAADERALLQEHLSYEYYLTGQHERAVEAQSEALKIWRASNRRDKEGNSMRWLSRLHWFAGRRAEANQYGVDAVAALESLPPSPELAMAYCERADLEMEEHDDVAAIAWAQRAITLAEPWARADILGHALGTLGTVRLIGGNPDGWADLDRSLQLALSADLPEEVARTYAHLSAMSVSHRKYARAFRYLHDGLSYCEERDLDSWWLYMLAYRARARFEHGDWLEAGEDVQAVLRHPRTTPVTRIPALRILGHLRVRRGDPDATSPLEEACALGGPAPELQRVGTLAAIYAEVAWLAGDREAVSREVRPAYELVLHRRDPRMKGELATWLWRVDALEDLPLDIPEPYALEISRDWRGAAHAWKELGCPYDRALVLGWYGAEREQREALAILERLGAAPATQLLRRHMRARGVRVIPRGSRTSTRHHPFGLTRREAQILALLSEGLRNAAIARRLFVSTKTVDHHVSAILSKLGVPSRAEAVAMAKNSRRG